MEQKNQGVNGYEDNILRNISFGSLAGIILQLSGLPAGQKAGREKYTVKESGPDRYFAVD